jgi:hypothetical protein
MGIPEGKRPLGKPIHTSRLEDKIIMDFREMG